MIYAEFAKIYDSLMYDFDYNVVYKFINKIIFDKDLDIKNVLELGCGTGNFTELISKDYLVDAVDFSDDMLSVAEQKLRDSNVNLIRQDMRYLQVDRIYDLVVSVCDSINYLLDEKDVENLFKNVADSLAEGGTFIFDLNTINKFKYMDNTYIDEAEGVFCVLENFYDQETNINLYSLNFFKEKNELYERFYEEHKQRAYSIDFIIDSLKSVGFKDIQIYDDYTYSQDIEDSDRIVYVARR